MTHTQPGLKTQAATATRTFFISGFGTALEFYDFIIYGLAAAIVFPAVFFPSFDKMVGTLVAFAAFGTGFIVRPLGGVVIGHFGDRIGRKSMLVLTLTMMGTSTFLIGCLPSYGAVGALAPILLVLLRLLQGFAAGGEWGGASLFGIENAPENRRGLWGSFTSAGIGIGSLFGSIVFTIITLFPAEQLNAWAWRIPFWLGGVLVLVGVLARSRMPKEAPRTGHVPRIPLLTSIKSQPRQMLLAIGVAFGYNTLAYIGSIFVVTYATERGYSDTQSLVLGVIGSIAFMVAAPVMGLLSDRVGRKRVVILGALAYAAFNFVSYPALDTQLMWLAGIATVIVNLLMAAPQGCIPAFLGEQFPNSTRYSSISATYQTGAALGGGTASTVAAALFIAFDGRAIGVELYTVAAALVLALCALGLRETAKTKTEELGLAPGVVVPAAAAAA